MRKAILILGMHRSGTSALARVLGLCGATLPKRRMRSVIGHEIIEYWEPRAVCQLHIELLRAMGSSIMDSARIPEDWFHSIAAAYFRKRISVALKKDFGNAEVFVMKDPRACRLVPLWLPVLEKNDIEPCAIISVRNPIEVAASLAKRQGLSFEKSYAVWLRHFLDAERDTRSLKRCFVSYDGLLENWQEMLDRIGLAFKIRWPMQQVADVNIFLKKAYRHHMFTAEDLKEDASVPASVITAYEWAVAASRGLVVDQSVLNQIDAEFSSTGRTLYVPKRFEPGLRDQILVSVWGIRHRGSVILDPFRRGFAYLLRQGLRKTMLRLAGEIRQLCSIKVL